MVFFINIVDFLNALRYIIIWDVKAMQNPAQGYSKINVYRFRRIMQI